MLIYLMIQSIIKEESEQVHGRPKHLPHITAKRRGPDKDRTICGSDRRFR